MAELEVLEIVVVLHGNAVGATEPGGARYDLDSGPVEEAGDTRGEVGHDGHQMLTDASHVDLGGGAHPPSRHTPGCRNSVGYLDQCLRRDAPHVEAGSAQRLALDQRDLAAESGGVQRCDIAARAAADDEEVDR